MGVLVDVVEDGKSTRLIFYFLSSVGVWVGGKPGRRLCVEVTTQDDVGCVCYILYVWRVVLWYCWGCVGRDISVCDCYVGFISSAHFY